MPIKKITPNAPTAAQPLALKKLPPATKPATAAAKPKFNNLKMKAVEPKKSSTADRIRELIVEQKHTDDEVRDIIKKERKKVITTISGFRKQLNDGSAEKYGYSKPKQPYARLERDEKKHLIAVPERSRGPVKSDDKPEKATKGKKPELTKEDEEDLRATHEHQAAQKAKKAAKKAVAKK